MPDTDILIEAHRVWFGPLAGPAAYPADKATLWFERKDETDALIRVTFRPHLDAVAATAWPIDSMEREAQIGLVIFLDQFPRNLFRDDARAYAFDALARQVALTLIEGGVERFALIERSFLYLPLEHSETLADQDLSVRLFGELLAAAPAEQADIYRSFLDFAEKHRDLIRRFGRFPHRNVDLGRVSTAEEVAFLKENGRGY